MKLAILPLMVTLTSCSSTVYRTYEGDTPLIQGKGGTRDVVNGIDFWREGSPPKKFRVVGTIEDDRPDKIIQMAMKDSAIATKVREAGGDGVILYDASSEVVGASMIGNSNTNFSPYGSAHTTGYSTSVLNRKSHSRYMVIKYADQP